MSVGNTRLMLLLLSAISGALLLIVGVAMLLRHYLLPQLMAPVEAELTDKGLQLDVKRQPLEQVYITIDNTTTLNMANLSDGMTMLPWSQFGLTGGSSLDVPKVQNVKIVGRVGARWFQTDMIFGKPAQVDEAVMASSVSQTWEYLEQPPSEGPTVLTVVPENP